MKSSLLKCVGVAFVALALVFTAGGCDSDSSSTSAEIIALWQLQEFILDDGTTTPVDDPTKYTVDFQVGGDVSIQTDCNRCSGRYFVDGNSLSFGPLACTIAACLPGSFDGQFQVALSTVSSYEIVDGSLFLRYAGGELRLIPAPALFQ
jgi:heat shock protein HslJ